MTDYQILKKVLYGAEVTIEKNKAWLDRYKSTYMEVDWYFCMMLFQTKIIDVDTGNFKTGETHYFLDEKFIKYNNRIKHILIKKIDEQLEDVRNTLTNRGSTYSKFPTYVRLLEAFDKIKNNAIRKQKLKKLNESR
jgi:hypothetical protein